MASPQPPSPGNKPLGFDEWIAISVAFSAIAAIFFWSVSKNGDPLAIVNSPSPPTSPQPSPTIPEKQNTSNRILTNSGQPSPTVTISPSPSPVQPQTRAIPFFFPGSNIATQPAINPSDPLPATPKPQPNPAKVAAIPAKSNLAPQTAAAKTTPIKFSDVPDKYWARIFIEKLAERKMIAGFTDGNFQPEKPVTRAELAAIIEGIVTNPKVAQKTVNFKDVKAQNWAASAIAKSVQTGYLKGYPGNAFRPDELVPRVQVLAALASGLNLKSPTNLAKTLNIYKDRKQVPSWATRRVAAATQAGLVVNYPKREFLNPNQPATRADVAAMIHQALVKLGKVKPQSSDYIVRP